MDISRAKLAESQTAKSSETSKQSDLICQNGLQRATLRGSAPRGDPQPARGDRRPASKQGHNLWPGKQVALLSRPRRAPLLLSAFIWHHLGSLLSSSSWFWSQSGLVVAASAKQRPAPSRGPPILDCFELIYIPGWKPCKADCLAADWYHENGQRGGRRRWAKSRPPLAFPANVVVVGGLDISSRVCCAGEGRPAGTPKLNITEAAGPA